MIERQHDDCFDNTFSDAVLVEFTSPAIAVLDESKLPPRLGRPSPEILEERAREAARFLAQLNEQPPSPSEDDESNKK